MWRVIKRMHCRFPTILKPLVLYPIAFVLLGPGIIVDFMRGKPFHSLKKYHLTHGMSPWRDVVDWVGVIRMKLPDQKKMSIVFVTRGSYYAG
jgi:hypothetical protein